jgi:hypothetical protein
MAEVARETQIQSQLQLYQTAVDELEAAFVQLSTRLVRVRRSYPEVKQNSVDEKQVVAPTLVPMAEDMRSLTTRVNEVIKYVHQIIDDIEL